MNWAKLGTSVLMAIGLFVIKQHAGWSDTEYFVWSIVSAIPVGIAFGLLEM